MKSFVDRDNNYIAITAFYEKPAGFAITLNYHLADSDAYFCKYLFGNINNNNNNNNNNSEEPVVV
jgi:hypothetical protein